MRHFAFSLNWTSGDSPVSKLNLTHLRPTFHLLAKEAQVHGCHRRVNSVHRPWLSQATASCESFNSKTARCVLEWRSFLLDGGAFCAGRTLARPRKHFQTGLVAGPQRTSARRVADQRITEIWKGEKQKSLSASPYHLGCCDESFPLFATARQQSN